MTSFDDDTEPPLATRGGDGGSPREQAPAGQAASAQGPSAQGPLAQGPSAQAQAARPGPASGERWRAWRAQAVRVLRHHWLVSALFVAGLVLRVLAQIGYRPALLYVDSLKYLYGASPGSDPLGYRLVLKVILLVGDLGTVAAIQHLLGLAMAVALYVVLLRRGVPVWLSALAVAPVLLDAYQLQMEQTIMPDVWFEALIVAGLAVLLWRPVLTPRFAVAAGLILGASATVKALGEFLILPALVYLLAAGGGMRRIVRVSAALVAAFALPILAYCGINYARTGHFWLARQQTLTGRLAAAADCATLKLPAQARPLCPTPAEQQALGPDGLEHLWGLSPLYATHVPLGTRGALISDIKNAVVHQQPGRVVVSILADSLRLFAPTRQATPWVTPIARWQFQAGYPTYPPWTNICPSGAAQRQGVPNRTGDPQEEGGSGLGPAAPPGRHPRCRRAADRAAGNSNPPRSARPTAAGRRSTSRWRRSCAPTSLTAATPPARCWPWPRWRAWPARCWPWPWCSAAGTHAAASSPWAACCSPARPSWSC